MQLHRHSAGVNFSGVRIKLIANLWIWPAGPWWAMRAGPPTVSTPTTRNGGTWSSSAERPGKQRSGNAGKVQIMRIRNLTVDDFFLLNELDWAPLPRERDSIYLTIALDQQPCSFIAQSDDGGFLGVLLASRGATGESIYVNHLLIAEPARRMGLGGKLMASLEDYARTAGVRRIWLHCQDETVEYYQSKGYRESYGFLSPELENYLRNTKGVHTLIKNLAWKV